MHKPNADAGIERRMPAAAPAWTEPNAHDPGITMLGLFAFLTTSLLYRAGGPHDGRTRSWAGALGVGLGAAAVTVWYAKSRSRGGTKSDATAAASS